MKKRLIVALSSAIAAALLTGCAESAPAMPSASITQASPAHAALAHAKAPCLYLLRTDEASNLSQMRITAPNCFMYINATANMSYSTIKAAKILYAGGPPNETGARFTEATPAPGPVVGDPCSTIRACEYLTNHPPMTSGCPDGLYNGSGQTIGSPGQVTCFRSLTISGSDETVCGRIEITGPLFHLNASSTRSCSSGVTFSMSAATNDLNFSGANLTLSPPATGKTKGVLFYRDAAQSNSVNFSNCACNLAGLLYFPTAQVTYGNTSDSYQLLIFGQVNFSDSEQHFGNPP